MSGLEGTMDWGNDYDWGDTSQDVSWQSPDYGLNYTGGGVGLNPNNLSGDAGLKLSSDYSFNDLNFGNWDSGSSSDWSFDNSGLNFAGNNTGIGFRLPGNDIGLKDIGSLQQLDIGSLPPPASGGTNEFIKQLLQNPDKVMKGLAALFEGNQNKKMGSALTSAANRSVFDPFGSQRPFYQNELRETVQSPYSSPMVSAQVKAIQEAQNRKDAAAGRRSNMIGSSPAVLAAQAQVAQNYMNSLMTPAGASISPNGGALAKMYTDAAKYNTNGYISPLMDAYGNMSREDIITQNLLKLLQGK